MFHVKQILKVKHGFKKRNSGDTGLSKRGNKF